jgi:hypothetical protein
MPGAHVYAWACGPRAWVPLLGYLALPQGHRSRQATRCTLTNARTYRDIAHVFALLSRARRGHLSETIGSSPSGWIHRTSSGMRCQVMPIMVMKKRHGRRLSSRNAGRASGTRSGARYRACAARYARRITRCSLVD